MRRLRAKPARVHPASTYLTSAYYNKSVKSVILTFAVLSCLHAADTLVGGPYVIHISPKSATVGWVVQSSEVKLGAAPDQLSQTEPVLRFEHVNYSNLKPGTTY